ncbi:MAG: replication protein [Lachnospiraceae bacterium]|nr:replication protein [Acetatifactor muris]MCM1223608.1 replication protein [Lachnospiraceae bacterium]
MSVRKQSRKWNLTINNPKEKEWTHEKLINTLQNIATMVYYCMGDEIGEEETFHTHMYFVTKNPKAFTTVKNFFPEAHIEASDGTSQQNRDYVFKEGAKFNKDLETGKYDYIDSQGKHHTGIHYDSSNEEFGELPQERQGQRTDIAELYEMIKDGYTNVEIMETNPKYMLHLDKIERARQSYRESVYSDTWRDIEVTYIWGLTGSGKTRSVMEKYGYSNVYRVTDYTHPFDSYRGQEIILFEEFRSSLQISDMLKYLDGYPVEFPARYLNKTACFTKVFFCTNIDLRYQYRHVQEEEPETWKAFLRRINNVCVMVDGKTMTYPTEIYLDDTWFFLTDVQAKDVPFEQES